MTRNSSRKKKSPSSATAGSLAATESKASKSRSPAKTRTKDDVPGRPAPGNSSQRTTRSGTKQHGGPTVSVVLTERTPRSSAANAESADSSANEDDNCKEALSAEQSEQGSDKSSDTDEDMYTDEAPQPISKKRPASLSPELGEDTYTPTPKTGRGKAILSSEDDEPEQFAIEDNGSGVDGDDEGNDEQPDLQGKGKAKESQPVTYVPHKFRHPGIPKQGRNSQPAGSSTRTPPSSPRKTAVPSTPSPHKRAKTSNANDNADNLEPMTPVSRLTKKMNTNQLASPGKATSGSSRGREARQDVMQDMVSSLSLESDIREHICPSLYGTYDNLPLLERAAIQETCLSRIAVNKLRVYLGCCHIRKDSDQERALVKIVTTPQFGALIYNPARADWRDFTLRTPPDAGGSGFKPRPFIAHIDDPDQRMCGIFFGGVHKSSVTEPQGLGNTGSMAKSVPLSPLCLEWARGFNWYGHLLDYAHMYVQAWDGSVSFITRTMKAGEDPSADRWSTNPFMSTTPKSARTTQGVRSVDYRTVKGDRTADLNAQLGDILAKNGLACTDKVPVFNMTSHYSAEATVSDIQTPDMFLARMADAPLWESEIPEKSFVAVLGVPFIYERHKMNNGSTHSDLRFNLVAVCLLATPFMQAT